MHRVLINNPSGFFVLSQFQYQDLTGFLLTDLTGLPRLPFATATTTAH